jgi:CRISPR-associated protein Csx17
MTMHLHHLTGCAPAPLAHYLKALGILRLVARQKDPEARGFWKDEHFCLITSLDRDALEQFFLDEYQPTPFVSPWNKGSGFYADDDPALGPVERSSAARFAAYRAGIVSSRAPLAAIKAADFEVRRLKDSTKKKKGMSAGEAAKAQDLKFDATYKAQLAAAEREFKRLKADLYAPFALSWRGGHREWMDAAMVLSNDGRPSWPSLLGTGGNDGRLDFTNNAMQRLGELFDLGSTSGAPTTGARPLLRGALWGALSGQMETAAVGQFLPGHAGGANGSNGPDAEAQVNPWDFVLMLEGSTAFRGETTRRLDARVEGRASIPFALHAHAVGHGSRGREKTDRGEQWMPLWDRPATFAGVESLLGEGRVQLGRAVAHRPLDFARAIGKLGVARGLIGFERYGYLERNGQSKIAVPLGRIQAVARVRARLVDDIGAWLDRLQRLVRDGDAPTRLAVAEARVADATFAALTRADSPAKWQEILVHAARVEALQATGTGIVAGPIPRLSAGWLDAASDDSPEWRLAVALGSAAADHARGRPLDSVRDHVLPLDRDRYATKDKRLAKSSRVVMTGRDALADLVALVERRLIEATQRGQRALPLVARHGAGAHLSDLAAFIEGRLDVPRTLWLARALMAVRWDEARPVRRIPRPGSLPEEAWQALRLCGLPFDIAGRRVPIDAGMVRRLASGDAAGAIAIALRRLRAAGLRPPIVTGSADPSTARRWAAALAFPIDPAVAEAMARTFQNHVTTETA